jgi:hypothetical protein
VIIFAKFPFGSLPTVQPLATDIPTAESLKLTSHATASDTSPTLPPSTTQETVLKRDDWMLAPESSNAAGDAPSLEDQNMTDGFGEPEDGKRTLGGGVDFFSSLGTERKKKPPPEAPDLKKVRLQVLFSQNYLPNINRR